MPITLSVEDGSGLPGVNSYLTDDAAQALLAPEGSPHQLWLAMPLESRERLLVLLVDGHQRYDFFVWIGQGRWV